MKQNLTTTLFKKYLFACVLFLASNVAMYAQILEISTAVPSTPIDLGANSMGRFTSIIVNTSKPQENLKARITNLQLTLPNGILIEPTSVRATTLGGASIPIRLHGTSIELDYLLESQESVQLTYSVTANCGIIPTTVDSSFSVFTSNELRVMHDIVKNNVVQSSSEEVFESSQDYEVTYPNLYVYVGSTTSTQHDNNKAVEWKVETSDEIRIKNIEGAGAASAIDFEVTWPIAQAIEKLSFTVNGAPIEATITEDKATFRINTSLLSGQSLTVVPTFTPKIYFTELQVTYKAFVVADGETCAKQTNASGIVNYLQEAPNTSMKLEYSQIQLANFCGQSFIGDFKITNSSPLGASNTLLNVYFEIGNTNFFTIDSVMIDNKRILPNPRGLYYIPAHNIDGDAISADMPPQSSYTVRIIASPTVPTILSSFNIFVYSTKINDLKRSSSQNYLSIGGLLNNSASISYPADSDEGDITTYTINEHVSGANLLDFSRNPFFDIKQEAYIVYNGADIKKVPIQNAQIKSAEQVSIQSSCVVPQVFDLQVATEGCSKRVTVNSVTGNTIVACRSASSDSETDTTAGLGNGSGSGSGTKPAKKECFTFNTTVVDTIVPTTINTCEVFDVHAVGSINHWCNDNEARCPKISKVVATIYEHEGVLELADVQATIFINGSAVTPTADNSLARQNGIAWVADAEFSCNTFINNLDSIELHASLMVKGNHALPDVSTVNIRVEFAVIDEKGIKHSANSKGSYLKVYDPEPRISPSNSFIMCNNYRNEITTTPAAPSVVQHAPTIIHASLAALEGYYYTTPDQTNKALEQDFNVSGYTIDGKNSVAGRVVFYVGAKCLDNRSTLPHAYATFSYTDYYESCDESTTKIFSEDSRISSSPVLTLSSSIEQGLTRYTTWNLTVKNTGYWEAPFVTLKIKPNEANEVDLLLSQIYVNDVLQTPVIYNDAWYITIPSLKSYDGESRVRIKAAAENCQDHGNSIIDVAATWSCMNLLQEPNVEVAFTNFSCNNPASTQLQMQNMLAVLKAESHYPPQGTTYKMCEPIPIALDVYNAGRAELTEVGLLFNRGSLPPGTSLEGNVIHTQYDGARNLIPINGVFILEGSDEKFMSFEAKNSKLSELVISTDKGNPSKSLLPTHSTDKDIIAIQFNMIVECVQPTDENEATTTLIRPLMFKSTATSNCGAEQQYLFQYYLPIAGIEQVQYMGVTASATPFATQANATTSTLTVVVSNNSLTPLERSALTITLPDGILVTTPSGDNSILNYALATNATPSGALEITLTAPAGYTIPPGESRTLSLQLQETQKCPQLEAIATVYGSILLDIEGCNGTLCPVEATTTNAVVDLHRTQAPLTIAIDGPTELCQAATATLTASGADSYVWTTGSTSATTAIVHPTTTYTVIGTSTEGCSDTASHTITFLQTPEAPLLSLKIADTISANSTIDFVDWHSIGEAMIKASPEGGTLEKQSGPANGCDTYTYTYTLTNTCGSTTTTLQFEVINCIDIACVEDDLVVIEGKPGYTLEDVHVLSYYIAHPELFNFSRLVYTIAVEDPCAEAIEYKLNPCFLDYADFNKDGVIDIHDKHILDQLILTNPH